VIYTPADTHWHTGTLPHARTGTHARTHARTHAQACEPLCTAQSRTHSHRCLSRAAFLSFCITPPAPSPLSLFSPLSPPPPLPPPSLSPFPQITAPPRWRRAPPGPTVPTPCAYPSRCHALCDAALLHHQLSNHRTSRIVATSTLMPSSAAPCSEKGTPMICTARAGPQNTGAVKDGHTRIHERVRRRRRAMADNAWAQTRRALTLPEAPAMAPPTCRRSRNAPAHPRTRTHRQDGLIRLAAAHAHGPRGHDARGDTAAGGPGPLGRLPPPQLGRGVRHPRSGPDPKPE
jgi:hypothetical protein